MRPIGNKRELASFKHNVIRLVLLWLSLATVAGVSASPVQSRDEQVAWSKLVGLAEKVLGSGGLFDSETDNRIDVIIELHAQFCRDVLGRPVSSQRLLLVKQAFKLFLEQVPARYQKGTSDGILRLIKDLAANRVVFAEFLTSNMPSEVIEEQLLGYLERNGRLSYTEPVPLSTQLEVPSGTMPLCIVTDSVRLVADRGTHGHYNRVVDAGETITINVPLENKSNEPYRSTSAFLMTEDNFIQTDSSEVVYCEKKIESGETVTFAPGMIVTPSKSFTFTVSPLCPDGHRVQFALLIMDSDHPGADFRVPFEVVISNIGPLDFGSSRIDDDLPGPSDGNADGHIDIEETIEFVLALQNRGAVQINEAKATLFCGSSGIRINTGDDKLLYRVVPPNAERPIASSFVFTVSGRSSLVPTRLRFRLLVRGKARGFEYSWLRSRVYEVNGVSRLPRLWTQPHANGANLGGVDDSAPSWPAQRWEKPVSALWWEDSPVTDGERLYVNSSALALQTGSPAWGSGSLPARHPESTPVLFGERVVFPNKGQHVWYTTSGAKIIEEPGFAIRAVPRGIVAIQPDGSIMMRNANRSLVWSLNKERLWTNSEDIYRRGRSYASRIQLACNDNFIIAKKADEMVCLSTGGGEIAWRRKHKVWSSFANPIIIDETVFYCGSRLSAFSLSDGSVIWEKVNYSPERWPDAPGETFVSEGPGNCCALAMGALAFLVERKELTVGKKGSYQVSPLGWRIVCIDPKTANTLWSTAIEGNHDYSWILSCRHSILAFFSKRNGGSLITSFRNTDGRTEWEVEMDECISAQPILAQQSIIIPAGSKLIAFGNEIQ